MFIIAGVSSARSNFFQCALNDRHRSVYVYVTVAVMFVNMK